MRFTYVLTSLVFYISLSAAWPWPANLFIRDPSTGQLAPRQDNNNNHASSSAAPAPASTAASNSAAQTGSATGSASGSGSAPSATPTGHDDSNHNDNSTSSRESSSVSITQAEVGGVSMIEPSTTTTTYYKMGQNITWVWNYTSLVVTPTAVDVVVSCASLGATYTIASNMSVKATGSVIWDTAQETTANPPPGTDKYTLAIYDAGNAAGPTQTNAPGMLGVWDQFTFAMYTPQPYTAVGDGYQCVTCNGAMSSAERQTMGVIFAMAAITVMSFTWFSSGFLSL